MPTPPPIPRHLLPTIANHESPPLAPLDQKPAKHRKSVPLAIALAIFGGPGGLIYSSPWLGLALCIPVLVGAGLGALLEVSGPVWIIAMVMSVVISRERNTNLGPAAAPPRLLRDLGTGFACVLGLWIGVGTAVHRRSASEETEPLKPAKIIGPAYEVDPPGPPPDTSSHPVFSAVTVEPGLYWRDFDANEVRATNFYKDKPLRITATVAEMSLTLGTVSLSLHAGGLHRIHANMDDSQTAAVENLRKGQVVTVLCKSAGKFAGMPLLRQCKLE